jgi:hypothetical protein
MNVLETALILGCLAAPFHWLIMRELARLDDPAWLSGQGVVVVKPEIIDGREAIGSYGGEPIWATVSFKGLTYGFDRVAPPASADRIRAGELFLPPGLVYRLE